MHHHPIIVHGPSLVAPMTTIVSITFPLAAMVIVLFLLWNDLLRRRPTPRFVLFGRAVLCLTLAAVLPFNWIRFRAGFEPMPLGLMVIASAVALAAALWFSYRGIRGQRFLTRREEPLPTIFSGKKNGRGSEEASRSPGPE